MRVSEWPAVDDEPDVPDLERPASNKESPVPGAGAAALLRSRPPVETHKVKSFLAIVPNEQGSEQWRCLAMAKSCGPTSLYSEPTMAGVG